MVSLRPCSKNQKYNKDIQFKILFTKNKKSSSPPLSAQRRHSRQSFLAVAQAGLAYARQKQVVRAAVETAPSPPVLAGSSFPTLWWPSLCHQCRFLSKVKAGKKTAEPRVTSQAGCEGPTEWFPFPFRDRQPKIREMVY